MLRYSHLEFQSIILHLYMDMQDMDLSTMVVLMTLQFGTYGHEDIQEINVCDLNGDETGLIGYWKFNSGEGNIL